MARKKYKITREYVDNYSDAQEYRLWLIDSFNKKIKKGDYIAHRLCFERGQRLNFGILITAIGFDKFLGCYVEKIGRDYILLQEVVFSKAKEYVKIKKSDIKGWSFKQPIELKHKRRRSK